MSMEGYIIFNHKSTYNVAVQSYTIFSLYKHRAHISATNRSQGIQHHNDNEHFDLIKCLAYQNQPNGKKR